MDRGKLFIKKHSGILLAGVFQIIAAFFAVMPNFGGDRWATKTRMELGILSSIAGFVAWLISARIEEKKDLEIEHLRTQVNPRTLKVFSGGEIAVAVQQFPGQKVDMTYMAFNAEAENFCDLLAQAFTTGGLEVHKHAPIVRNTLPTQKLSFDPKRTGGILISYATDREPLAKTVFNILKALKFSIGSLRVMNGTDEDDFIYGSDSLLVHISQKDA